MLSAGICSNPAEQCPDIRFAESQRFHDGKENFRPYAVAVEIDTGVFIGPCRGPFRIAGSEAGPELAADRRSHTAGEMIVEAAGKRGADSQRKIAHRHGVFVDMEIHMLFPDPRKHFPVRRRFFHFQEGGDVHRLKLKVVVGHGLLRAPDRKR